MDELIKKESEQQVQYDRMEEAIGSETLALFCACAAFNVPYIDKYIPRAKTRSMWTDYKRNLRIKKLDGRGFAYGATDIRKLFGEEGVEAEEIPEIVQNEQKKHPNATKTGTQKQVKTWGLGSPEDPFTKEDYDRLDDLFDTYSSRLVEGGGMDVQQEDTLRQVSIMRLKRDKLILAGDKDSTATAKQLDMMIKENLSAEQLRKADAKPVEEVRIDSIINALETWGAVKDGKILSYPDLTEFLLRELGRLGGTPAHQYTQTLDAADYELLFIQNCMAQNEDLPKWMELPDNMRFSEEVAHEFTSEPTSDEQRAYEGIGIVRNRPKPKEKDEGED